MERDVPRSSAFLMPSPGCAISTWILYDGRYYSTTTGNTETAAGYIAEATGLDAVRGCSARAVEDAGLVSTHPACQSVYECLAHSSKICSLNTRDTRSTPRNT